MAEERGNRRPLEQDRGSGSFKRSRYDHEDRRTDDRGGRFDDRRFSRGSEFVLDEDLVMCPTYEGWRQKSADNNDPAKYTEYVKEWVDSRADLFAKRHWKEDWFLERYDPERAEERLKQRRELVSRRSQELSPSSFVPLVQSAENEAVVIGAEPQLDDSCCAYLPHVGPFVPRSALEKALIAEGAISVLLSEVNRAKKRRDLGRRGTVVFKDAQSAKDCVTKGFVTCWVTMDPDGVTWESTSVKDDRRSEVTVTVLSYKALPNRLLPIEANNLQRMEKDAKQARFIAEILDRSYNVDNSSGVKAALEGKPESVSELDATIQYLRCVHLFCYYSGSLCRDYGEFIHKAGSPFLRVGQPVPSSSSSSVPVPSTATSGEPGDGEDSQSKERKPAPTTGHNKDQQEQDPKRFFETIDVCAEKIIADFEDQHKVEMERQAEALKRRVSIANETLETFVAQNTVLKNSHVYCQVHDKLFQNEVFFRKHLLNFHSAAIRSTQRKALLDLLLEMFHHDEDKPLPRLSRFAEDVIRGDFVPPPERTSNSFEARGSAGSDYRGGFGRPRREDDSGSGSQREEPQVRRYRDPDAPKPDAVPEKPQKLQYRTRVSYAGSL